MRRCDSCGNAAASASLVTCGGCTMTHYCDSECQESHWSEHKSACKTTRNTNKELNTVFDDRAEKAVFSPDSENNFVKWAKSIPFEAQAESIRAGVDSLDSEARLHCAEAMIFALEPQMLKHVLDAYKANGGSTVSPFVRDAQKDLTQNLLSLGLRLTQQEHSSPAALAQSLEVAKVVLDATEPSELNAHVVFNRPLWKADPLLTSACELTQPAIQCDLVRYMLQLGVSPKGRGLINFAVDATADTLKVLLDAGMGLLDYSQKFNNNNIFHVFAHSAVNDAAAKVALLAAAGVKLEGVNGANLTPLMAACRHIPATIGTFDGLVAAGANTRVLWEKVVSARNPLYEREPGWCLYAREPGWYYAIHPVAGSGRMTFLQRLLDRGVVGDAAIDVDVRDSEGRTALHYAAGRDCADMVEALLEAGASAKTMDKDGLTPYEFAAHCGSYKGCKALAEAGALDKLRPRNKAALLKLVKKRLTSPPNAEALPSNAFETAVQTTEELVKGWGKIAAKLLSDAA